ncbi:MAG: single-stranded-DNA-specific exonuclease RecJ [Candidatus Absconditabacterales bacterium]
MNFKLIYDNPKEDLLTRLFKVRGIDDNIDSFLDPKLSDYRGDPFLLNDMEKSVQRIILAMKNKEKIMIFGDYDVDGITSSYILYQFLIKFLHYKQVSIQYPDRIEDGYGIKKKHIDDIKSKGVSLIITVDNGISTVQEAEYAKELGIDIIITDHHQHGEKIPPAFAVITPLISPEYPFKYLAGVGVAFKLICALTERSTLTKDIKNRVFNYFLPVVAIGTVADVVPLIHENRVIVKRGLELINRNHEHMPTSLKGFLKYLNLKDNVDTFHIGFIIGPRINAGGRIESPYDSLKALLYTGEKQVAHLDKIEGINTERKRMQEEALKKAEGLIDLNERILIATDESFHEGIVGIVAGRLTERYTKPCMILKINKETNLCVASLRGPDYFNIIEMISTASDLLERFGGHKGAGGLAVKLENLDKLIQRFQTHCNDCIQDHDLIKSIKVDTKIYQHEWDNEILGKIQKLAPFGEGNSEPVLLLEDITINKVEKVGNNGKSHLKIHGQFGDNKITAMFRGKGSEVESLITRNSSLITVIGKIRKDTYNGGYFIDGADIQ